MISEEEMIDADYDDLSDSDMIVLLFMNEDGTPVSKTRLQQLWVLYHNLYEKNGSPNISSDEND